MYICPPLMKLLETATESTIVEKNIQNEKRAKTQIPQPALDRFNVLSHEPLVTCFTWFLVANPYLAVPLVLLWERKLTVQRLESLHQP